MTDLKEGLKDRSPAPPSDKPKGESVDANATRSKPAASPKTLGPRSA